MQFLKILFWALLVGVIVAFALNNMTMVPLRLWGTLYADVNLPLLLFVTFLAGFLPTFVALRVTRWRLKQRLAGTDLRKPDPVAGDPAPVLAPAPGAAL